MLYSREPFPASARVTPDAAAMGGLGVPGLVQPAVPAIDSTATARMKLCTMILSA
jgi:hypothetical protein